MCPVPLWRACRWASSDAPVPAWFTGTPTPIGPPPFVLAGGLQQRIGVSTMPAISSASPAHAANSNTSFWRRFVRVYRMGMSAVHESCEPRILPALLGNSCAGKAQLSCKSRQFRNCSHDISNCIVRVFSLKALAGVVNFCCARMTGTLKFQRCSGVRQHW